MRVRKGRGLRTIVGGLALVALAGCGRGPDYQYLEVPDGKTFAKVPSEWTIDSQGWVDFVFVEAANLNTAFVPGDDPIAWRAAFNGDSDGSVPSGVVSVQSVDAGDRPALLLGPMIAPIEGTEEVSRAKVRSGKLEGWRARHVSEIDGESWVAEQLILTDPRRSTVYYVRIVCTERCHDSYRSEIEEVMTTFRVEL